MFIQQRSDELREKLGSYIQDNFISISELAIDLELNPVTVRRFLRKEKIKDRTLLKIGRFLIEQEAL